MTQANSNNKKMEVKNLVELSLLKRELEILNRVIIKLILISIVSPAPANQDGGYGSGYNARIKPTLTFQLLIFISSTTMVPHGPRMKKKEKKTGVNQLC